MVAVGPGSEIVGRDSELADIRSAVAGLASGEGGFRAYVGEPGIGKTRMLVALSAAAREAGVPALWDRAGEQGKVAETVRAAAGHRCALVVVDDVHLLDGDALEQLLTLAEDRVLLAVAYRPRQLPPATAAMLFRSPMRLGVRQLAPLTLDIIRRLIGDRPDLHAIHRASEGIPLYAKALADPTFGSSSPLLAELAALPPAELAVAQAASVLAGPFVPDTLLAMSTMDAKVTLSALDGLVSGDVLRTSQPGQLLAFRHRTLAVAAYHTTTISQRRALHLMADRALERLGAPAIMRAAHVASSFDLAHPERYSTLMLGARQALTTDPALAISWLEAVEVLLPRDDPHWHTAQLLLATARLRTGRLDDSRATFLPLTTGCMSPVQTDAVMHTGRIERLLGRYPEAAALIRRALNRAGTTTDRVIGLIELSAIATDNAEHGDSDRLATEAARSARSLGDPVLECLAHGAAAWARTALGDIAGGADAVSQAAQLADAMLDSVALRDIDCLRLLGQSEALLDRLADARRHLSRGVRLAQQTGQRHVLPNLLKSLAEVELRLGRLDQAGQILDEVEPLTAETGVIAIQSITASVRAETLLWQLPSAQVAQSVAAAERAAGYGAGANAVLTWALHAQAALGEAVTFAGQPSHGGQILLSAGGGPLLPRIAAHRRVRWWEILAISAVAVHELSVADEYATLAMRAVEHAPTDIRRGYACRARLLVDGARGATATALAAGEAAISSFMAAGALLELGRTYVLVSSVRIDAGQLDAVPEKLAIAAALARRCHSRRLAEEVDRQLARLPTEAGTGKWRAALTPREHDIAVLAGQAMASTTIAAKLHLSVRTVDSHLGRIYRKLGVANRVALANLLTRMERV